jgi:hypothetical protein
LAVAAGSCSASTSSPAFGGPSTVAGVSTSLRLLVFAVFAVFVGLVGFAVFVCVVFAGVAAFVDFAGDAFFDAPEGAAFFVRTRAPPSGPRSDLLAAMAPRDSGR